MTFIFSENIHMRTQPDGNNILNILLCGKCSKGYINKRSLLRHMKSCSGLEKPFACDLCDYRAKLKHHIKDHIHNVHLRPKGTLPKHICFRCDRKYIHKHHLISHLKHECGQEPRFQCNFCSYRSKMEISLLNHIERMHNKK